MSCSLFTVAAIATTMTGVQRASAQHIAPARLGSAVQTVDAGCWRAHGPSMTNDCGSAKDWYMPLFDPPGGVSWVTVTAQGASNSSNVTCLAYGWGYHGDSYYQSFPFNLTQFGPVVNIDIPLYTPPWGTGEVDCSVLPGGKVITVIW